MSHELIMHINRVRKWISWIKLY